MTVDQFLDRVDLTGLHTVACFLGAGLAVYVMQMNSHVDQLLGYSKMAARLTRFSLGLIGMALMWAAYYPASKGWQPWPPDVLVILSIDFALGMRAVTIALRWREDLKDPKSSQFYNIGTKHETKGLIGAHLRDR